MNKLKLFVTLVMFITVACAPKQRPRPYFKKKTELANNFVEVEEKSVIHLTPQISKEEVEVPYEGVSTNSTHVTDANSKQRLTWVKSVLFLDNRKIKINPVTKVVMIEGDARVQKQDFVESDLNLKIKLSGTIDVKSSEALLNSVDTHSADIKISGRLLCLAWDEANSNSTCSNFVFEIYIRKDKAVYSSQFVYQDTEIELKKKAEAEVEAQEQAKNGKQEDIEDDVESSEDDPNNDKGTYITPGLPEAITGVKSGAVPQMSGVPDSSTITKLSEEKQAAEKNANEKKAEEERENLKKAEFEKKLAEADRAIQEIEKKYAAVAEEKIKLKAQLDAAEAEIKASQEKQTKTQAEIEAAKANEAKAKADAAAAKSRAESAQRKVEVTKAELTKAQAELKQKEEQARLAQAQAEKSKAEKDKQAAQLAQQNALKAKADAEAKAKADQEAQSKLKQEQDAKVKAEQAEQQAKAKAETEAHAKLAAEEAKKKAEQDKLEAEKKQKALEEQLKKESTQKEVELKKVQEEKAKAEVEAKKAKDAAEKAKIEADKALALAKQKEEAETRAKEEADVIEQGKKGNVLDAATYAQAYKNKLGGSNLKPTEFVVHSLNKANSGAQKSSVKLSDRVRDMGDDAPMREVSAKDREDYGNPVMVEFIARVSQQAREKIISRTEWVAEVKDIAKLNGGYLYPHKSHQNGLDADIGYIFKSKNSGYYGQGVVNGHHIDSDFDIEAQYKWFTQMVQSNVAQVHYIFVHHVIKDAMCKMAKEKGVFAEPDKSENADVLRMLRRLYPRPNDHHDHFHLRLKCPLNNKGCYLYPETKNVTGC